MLFKIDRLFVRKKTDSLMEGELYSNVSQLGLLGYPPSILHKCITFNGLLYLICYNYSFCRQKVEKGCGEVTELDFYF